MTATPTLFFAKALQVLLLNCLVFAVYRVAFLASFADPQFLGELPRVLLRGVRLDVALLSREMLAVAAIALVMRDLRYRVLLAVMWGITSVNAAVMLVNFFFFHERNQHLWEMLLANLGRPSEIVVAVEPFVDLHPYLPFVVLLLMVGAVAVARRHTRVFARARLPRWRNLRTLAALATIVGVLWLPALEAVPHKGQMEIATVASKHYMQFADYVVNQAVINPLYDLFRYYGPSAMAKTRYQLERDDALRTSTALLGLAPRDEQYPLVRTIRGDTGLGHRNVVLIQVEGLTATVLEHRVHDGWVMPFLHDLATRGLYFPTMYQSFNATDGSIFATATSLHRTFAVREGKSHFFPYETNGLYGCLPRILDPAYEHFFFAGFRQRIADYLSFMSNQGFESIGYYELLDRLGSRAAQESNLLGVHDRAMLDELADDLVATRAPFTAHVITATSHSPWEVPPMPDALPSPQLSTFRYADQSIRHFVERLRAERPDFARTLFAIIGDHTSMTFSDSLTERIRVSLILHSPALERDRTRWVDRQSAAGSHVDIVPTILGLLDGEHVYSGMGRNLLDESDDASGIISSTHHDSLYIKDGFALHFTPHESATQLFAIEAGEIDPRDVADRHPELAAQLTREYLALYETADHLTREKRVLPRLESGDQRLSDAH